MNLSWRNRRSTRLLVGGVCLVALGAAWLGARRWLNAPAFAGPTETAPKEATHAPKASDEDEETDASEKPESESTPASPSDSTETLIAPRQAILTRKIETPPLTGTTNLLLIGLDKKPGDRGLGRPDTIVIAALEKESKHLGLVSVPRDLYVNIEGHGEDRINATYAAALASNKDPSQWLARVLTDTLALPIHHTIVVDLGAFEQLVDAIDGVDVDVPCPIVDDFLDTRTETGRRILDVPEGLVHMDGVTAGLYARSRHGRSDWNRARRQQAILFAIKHKAKSLAGLRRLPDLFAALDGLLKSDLTRAEALTLASELSELSRENIHGLVLGQKEAIPTRLESGKQVLVPDPEAISLALSRLFAAPAPGALPERAACFAKDVALAKQESARD